MEKELKDSESVCTNCDIHTNDNHPSSLIATKWDSDAQPYCVKCFNQLNKTMEKEINNNTEHDTCDHAWQEEPCSSDGCEDITKWCNKCHTYVLCDGEELYNM